YDICQRHCTDDLILKFFLLPHLQHACLFYLTSYCSVCHTHTHTDTHRHTHTHTQTHTHTHTHTQTHTHTHTHTDLLQHVCSGSDTPFKAPTSYPFSGGGSTNFLYSE